jgi:hypothetical protein
MLFAWFVIGLMTGHSYSKEGSAGIEAKSREEKEELALAGR